MVLSNVPSPDVVHIDDVADPPLTPLRETVLPEQIVWAGPASIVGAAWMVIITLSLAGRQGPAGSLVVKVNVTLVFAMSVGPGVYSAVGEVASLKDPSPDVVHVALDAPLPKDPANIAFVSEQSV